MVHLDTETTYSLVYGFLCLCFVVPPHEVAAAGFTIQNIFGKFLGDERINFIDYHIRRGCLTLMVHSLLPLGYFVLMVIANPRKFLIGFFNLSLLWQIGFVASLSLLVSATICIWVWSLYGCKYHPLKQHLKNLVPGENQSSSEVASAINTEMRRFNMFNTGHYSQKLYVTENWIIKVNTYSLDIVHQRNCVLSLHSSQQYTLSESSPHGVQMLQINVNPVDTSKKGFVIWMNAANYSELRDHLQGPLVNARNVVIHQTVTEQFVQAFTHTISNNPKYKFDPTEAGHELENCMGCLQERASVKLMKLCAGETEGDCRQCFCRPLWCISCMAKWFCNRQNQSDTSSWLAGKAPCPMCRATFCLADVCCIELTP